MHAGLFGYTLQLLYVDGVILGVAIPIWKQKWMIWQHQNYAKNLKEHTNYYSNVCRQEKY